MIDVEQRIMEDMVIKPQQALIKLDKKKKEFNEAFNKLVAEKGYASFEDVYKELGWEYPFKKNVPASPEPLEDEIEGAKDKAMKDIAWQVHCMISEGKSIAEIDHYVCGICDF